MRGKHAAVAAARREQASYESEIETYQREVHNQKSEISALRAEAGRWKEAHAKDTRALRAQIAEGTSSELAALTIALKSAKDKAARIEDKAKALQKSRDAEFTRIVAWLKAEKGVSGTEALELWLRIIGHSEQPIISDSARKKGDPEASARIDVAKGIRKFPVSGGAL
jgi:predicted RNase H-like nuclease (RuvC/YqgF family)